MFAEHDARYDYGAEWLGVVKRLMEGERVTHAGAHFAVTDYALRPAAATTRPAIYLGGESEPARRLAATASDVWFINGQPLEDVRTLIDDVAGRPRGGAALRFGLSAFVIARETDEEAEAAYRHLLALAAEDGAVRAAQAANTDAAVAPMAERRRGWLAAMTGWWARMRAFHAAGIELFRLQFQLFKREMRRFAGEVRPRL